MVFFFWWCPSLRNQQNANPEEKNVVIRFFSGLGCFTLGMISISISAWQYESGSNGSYWSSWDTICSSWPIDILRPISITIENTNYAPFYCGYSAGNTGWRLFVGIFTLILGLLIFFKIFMERALTLALVYGVFFACWMATSLLDIFTIANAQASCSSTFTDYYHLPGIDCDNSIYGVTVAIDMVIVIAFGLMLWTHLNAIDSIAQMVGDKSVRYDQPTPVATSPPPAATPSAPASSSTPSWLRVTSSNNNANTSATANANDTNSGKSRGFFSFV